MPDDLTIVAQYAKSNRDTPSDVYNAACRLLDETEAIRAGAEKLLNLSLDEGRRANEAEALRDAFRSRLNDLCDYASWCLSRSVEPEERDILFLAKGVVPEYLREMVEAFRKATQSHGDGRTPQTLGMAGQDGAREAQEARE